MTNSTPPKQTAKEVAQSICTVFREKHKLGKGCACEEIAQALTEYAEAYSKSIPCSCFKHDTLEQARKEGFAAGAEKMREMAAEEAKDCPDEQYGDNCHESIPRRIRLIHLPESEGV